ncbi:Pleckstrin-like proteiny domain [Sesbania bispinosa]|nr:Pleckstrin-like proteiny domain [Sesbania bispinosa]
MDAQCSAYDNDSFKLVKSLSLRKGTKSDVAAALEEELHSARSTFEQARFNLVTALSNVEAKKRFEFLEAVSGTMDAHLRYFKQGYELLHQMEPYINQVLTYAQQSRERSNYEQAALNERMQEYKRQIDRESRWASNGSNGSPNGDGIQAIGRSSHKMIEAVMQSAAKGKVQTIRQGYLSKRSSNLRGDWKRRFFVLDSRGMLYYYRKQCSKSSGSSSQHSGQRNSSELGSGLLSRWLSSHHHGGVHDEKSVAHHTAESALDQMDWIEKITGVIASLLSSQIPERLLPASPMGSGDNRCADCGAPEPDWASLNLGVLVCIECSGVHRNLGVHISKVRSLTLDVKVWEPSVISLFQSLGNTFANSVWEELLQSRSAFQVDLVSTGLSKSDKQLMLFITKPCQSDSLSVKESSSMQREAFCSQTKGQSIPSPGGTQIWEAVRANDKKAVYRYIVNSDIDVNLGTHWTGPLIGSLNSVGTKDGQAMDYLDGCTLLHLACETADIGMLELLLQYGANINATDLRGQTPLHRCILKGKSTFARLLLSRGADPQAVDEQGRTPIELAAESNADDREVHASLTDSNG